MTPIKKYPKNHKGGVPLAEYKNLMKHYDNMTTYAAVQEQEAKDQKAKQEHLVKELKSKCDLNVSYLSQLHKIEMDRAENTTTIKTVGDAINYTVHFLANFKIQDKAEIIKQISANFLKQERERLAAMKNEVGFNEEILSQYTSSMEKFSRGDVFLSPESFK